jgi:hypothetical protein
MQFPQLHVGIGRQFGPFTIFPVWSDARGKLDLSTGTHAQLQVTELASGPEVSRLTVRNAGPRSALLIEGELLEGGHQHRVAAESLVLSPGEQADVPAFCVEQGRWSGPSTQHGRRARRAPLHVRAELAGLGGPRHGDRQPDQGRVWQRVGRFASEVSTTGSLVEALDAAPRPDLKVPAPLEGQRGVVIGLAGRALMLELFGTSTMFARHWAQLADALRFEAGHALGLPQHPTPGQAARDFVAALPATADPFIAETRDYGDEAATYALRGTAGRIALRGLGLRGEFPRPFQIAHMSAWDATHPFVTA